MGHLARLQLVGRITYYLGWISLILAGIAQLRVGQAMFLAMNVTKRNLFELSVVCFLICIASELRLIAPSEKEASSTAKRPAAA